MVHVKKNQKVVVITKREKSWYDFMVSPFLRIGCYE